VVGARADAVPDRAGQRVPRVIGVAAIPEGDTWHDIDDAGTMMLAMTVKFCPVCERYFHAGMLCGCGGDLGGESGKS
jgi:hypothetical protein